MNREEGVKKGKKERAGQGRKESPSSGSALTARSREYNRRCFETWTPRERGKPRSGGGKRSG